MEVLAVGVLAATAPQTLALDALSFPPGPAGATAGFRDGGCGWSFVPTTNIVITSVGYLDLVESGGNQSVVVTIWSGSNSVLASYTGITDPAAAPDTIISAAIPSLPLAAGQAYSITVHTAPLSGSVTAFAIHDNVGILEYNPFNVAAELSQYEGLLLNTNGTFSPLSSDPTQNRQLLYLGPSFTFEVLAPRPVLTIAAVSNRNIRLSWPTNAAGFSLQTGPRVSGTYTAVTNSPSVVGTNYSTTLPGTNAAAFFRLSKPN